MARFVVTASTVLALTAAGASGSAAPRPDLISFADGRHGVASFSGTAAWTGDGGRTWHLVAQRRIVALRAVAGTREVWASVAIHGTGCASLPPQCGTRLVRSTDGGATWSSPGARLLAPDFATRRAGWAVQRTNDVDGGRLVATTDGGRSWQPAHDPCRHAAVKLTGLASARRGWVLCLTLPAVGMQGKALYETRDAARHWRLVTVTPFPEPKRASPHGLPLAGYPWGLAFVASGTGLVWEARGDSFATHDGGGTWHRLSLTSPELDEIRSASVVDGHLAFALLRNGHANRLELRRSDDGLRTWRVVRSWPLS